MAEKKTLPRVERVEGEERKKALSAALAQIENNLARVRSCAWAIKG